MTPTYKVQYVRETRIIPLNKPKNKLEIRNSSGITRKDEILEFCRTPRTSDEIGELINVGTKYRVTSDYLRPLIKSGKICLTIPEFPTSNFQRYVNVENADIIPSESAILEYCKIPRTNQEIGSYFGMCPYHQKILIQRLLKSKKLVESGQRKRMTDKQKYISSDIGVADDGAKTV